jgi:hypothetical protein
MAKRSGIEYYTEEELHACRLLAEGRGAADMARTLVEADDTRTKRSRMWFHRLKERATKDGLTLDVRAGLVAPVAEDAEPAAEPETLEVLAGVEVLLADEEAIAKTPVEQLEEIQTLLLRTARAAAVAGNATITQRAGKAAGDMIAIALRARREQRLANEGVLVTTEEILSTRAKLRDVLTALHSRPLLCAHCSRALSVEWGGADKC